MSSYCYFMLFGFLLTGCNNEQDFEQMIRGKESSENRLNECIDRQKNILKKYEANFDEKLISALDFLINNDLVREQLSPCSK